MAGKRKTGPGDALRPESLESAKSNLGKGASLAEITAKAFEIQKANNAETEMTAKKGKKGQTKLPIDDRGTRLVAADHELRRKMTEAEWGEQSAKLAHERVELMELEDRIRRLKAELAPRMKDLKESTEKGARQVDERAWLAVTPCIEVHDPSTRTVTVCAIGKDGPGEVVIPSRLMTESEFETACASMPFSPPVMDPPDGETLTLEGAGPSRCDLHKDCNAADALETAKNGQGAKAAHKWTIKPLADAEPN